MKIFILNILLLCSCYKGNSIDRVNSKNGNFFITYTDIAFLENVADLTRSYNSKSTFSGLFGFGWGSELDSRIYAIPDGSIVLANWGGGYKDYFTPPGGNSLERIKFIDQLIKNELANGKLKNDPVLIAAKKSELSNNVELRVDKYLTQLNNNQFPKIKRDEKKRLTWKNGDDDLIIWENDRYTVKYSSADYTFNADGTIRSYLKKKFNRSFEYANGKLAKIIIDTLGNAVVTTDAKGRITKVSYIYRSGTDVAEYTYNDDGDLTWSKDAGDNEYRFSYDKAHDLVMISYKDSTSLKVEYDPLTFFATKVTERDGKYKTYRYLSFYDAKGGADPDHYATEIKDYNKNDSLLFSNYAEYEVRTNNDERYTYRFVRKTDTSYHEVINHPVSHNAVYRKHNNKQAWAKYDAKGRGTYLRLPDSVFIVEYDLLNRITRFRAIDSIKKDTLVYSYTYSAGGLSSVLKGKRKYDLTRNADNSFLVKRDGNQLKLYLEEGNIIAVEIPGSGEKTAVTEFPKMAGITQANVLYHEFQDVITPRNIPEMLIWQRL